MKLKTLTMLACATLLLQACASTTIDTTPASSSVDMYRVKDGESLMLIAEKVYGSRSDWVKIYEANIDTIDDAAVIYPNQMIVLPE